MEAFVLTPCNSLTLLATSLFYPFSPAALQKDIFRNAKGILLNDKRPCFASQKIAFYKILNINLLQDTVNIIRKRDHERREITIKPDKYKLDINIMMN